MMSFGNFQHLPVIGALLGAVLLVFILNLLWKRSVKAALKRSGVDLMAMYRGSRKRELVKTVMVPVALVLFAFILLRPQWGERFREVTSEGSDVLIMLDVSRSMLATDVDPTRLERAKSAVRWIAQSLKGDRIGLILFAGDAFLQCPLTRDTGAFLMFLDAATPDSIRRQGTDIGRALDQAHRVFTTRRMTSRILVIITDGEDHETGAYEAAARFRELDVSIYAVGVGRESGASIDRGGGEQGSKITTKKNTGLLKKLAGLTGGSYLDITRSMHDLGFILEIIDDQEKNQYGTRVIKEPVDRFIYPALLLFFLLLADFMLPLRPSPNGATPASGFEAFRKIFPRFIITASLLLFPGWLDPFADHVRSGNRKFHDKKYPDALADYDRARDYSPGREESLQLDYNRGGALHKLEKHDEAVALFQKALESKDPSVQKKAFFNMGNSHLKAGRKAEAAAAYINALKIDPNYLPAKKNLEYLERREQEKKKNDSSKDNDKNGEKSEENQPGQDNQINDPSRGQDSPSREPDGKNYSREQLDNLLRAMNKKPVRRIQGDGKSNDKPAKNW